jgi:carbamoyltransferase
LIDPESQRFADIAASVQKILEEAVLAYAKRSKQLTQRRRLCYAGGVALNCVANSKLTEANLFEDVYIPTDPGDGGAAMGAALYLHSLKRGREKGQLTPYLGKSVNVDRFEEFVRNLEAKELVQSKIGGLSRKVYSKLEIQNYEFEQLVDQTSALLVDRNIVGWVQDRFENGPRALGNRSILCRPDCIDTATRLSKQIKLRESFRPYAASLIERFADEVLEPSLSLKNRYLTKWMQSSFVVKAEHLHKLRAACHADATTRAQLVSPQENLKFSWLLESFRHKSGIPALLNTSFNAKGLPLVNSAYDALAMFLRTDMDAVAIGNFLIMKSYPTNTTEHFE